MSEAYQVTPSVGVNIRSGPGTGYSKVGAYAQGTVVTVTATEGVTWYASLIGSSSFLRSHTAK